MENNDINQELLPFDQIKNKLLTLCDKSQNGDFWLFTEEKHTAIISLNDGEIVGLRYRISRGFDALKKIQSIEKAKIKFQASDTSALKNNKIKLPPTVEILKMLGINFNDCKKKIMIVEDSPTQRKFISRMLKEQGYLVMEAGDGYEALSQLANEKPDLILLDIVMPGMDGYEVMSAIKKMEDMEDVRIIMLTARGSLINKVYGKVAGTDEYLTKPFKSDELIGKIGKYLSPGKYSQVNHNDIDHHSTLQNAHA